MASPIRVLATDTQAEIIKQHTRPVMLVKIQFSTGQWAYLSETKEITWESHIYVEGSVKVSPFRWTSDGEATGNITLVNNQSSATALVLSTDTTDAKVWIYQTYLTGLLSTGIGETYLRVTPTGDIRVTPVPDRRITQEQGPPPVTPYDVFTTPELLVTGVIDGATVGYDFSELTVYTSRAKTEFVPNRFFSVNTGFVNLPAPGTVIWWLNEKFILEEG